MQQAIEILFKAFFPECAKDEIKVIQSKTIHGKNFFYAMADGKKVKCFPDYMQVLQRSGKEEKVMLELTITQVFALGNVYQDGTKFEM